MPRAAERVSRRELKQDDAFVEAMTPLVDQLEKNWKTIAFAVGGALIAVLAAVTILTISAPVSRPFMFRRAIPASACVRDEKLTDNLRCAEGARWVR